VNTGLQWDRDGRDWPNREHSRFVKSSGLTWHVQQMGRGPVAVLVHGTGASTHSWRLLAPILARSFTVVMPDLPGHGFTQLPHASGLSLPAMARGLSELLVTLNVQPSIAVGHSAGAAVLLRATLDRRVRPDVLVSINGALLPFDSPIGQLFSPLAKFLALNSLVPRLAAWGATRPAAVERLIRNTGSKLDAVGIEYYRRLFCSPEHVSAALGMMAQWDLTSVVRDLPRLDVPMVLVAALNDLAVSPDEAGTVCRLTSRAQKELMPGAGHLAHEEDPATVAEIVLQAAHRSCDFRATGAQSHLQAAN
jgi:magnesium chelatase accessory protein